MASILLGGVALFGCAGRNPGPPQSGVVTTAGYPTAPTPKTAPVADKEIVSPERGVAGKVATVNTAGRYVVVSFAVNRYPRLEDRLNVYRQGLKVGEIKVNGPQMGENFVADLISGEAAVGDDVLAR